MKFFFCLFSFSVSLLNTPVTAQRGHLSELVHMADSVFQLVETVPAQRRPALLSQLRTHVDSLRVRYLRLREATNGMANTGQAGLQNPGRIMNSSYFSTGSRANKVAQDRYLASLVVLDSLWLYTTGSSRVVLRPEDLLLVNEKLESLRQVREMHEGKMPSYEDMQHQLSNRMTKELYETAMSISRQYMMALDEDVKTQVLSRLDVEESLLSAVLR